ncbi:hypothetical protein [Catenuloplanes japonicus]|uniref:hypothetical protein n=1 Tax=Catenuloplanes japonicus TaxID=33876 RepID=UPI000AB908A4|nr:hypothetical protein [Catenuloplanes japonicus]
MSDTPVYPPKSWADAMNYAHMTYARLLGRRQTVRGHRSYDGQWVYQARNKQVGSV